MLALLLLTGAGALAYALTPLPDVSAAAAVPDTRILDRHGALIADLPQGGVRHEVVPFAAFPLTLRQATLAAEDFSFYHNPGVDPLAIGRAALLDAGLDRAAYGGSTITQQLVRNLLLSPRERASRSLGRKLHEALLAVKLTRHADKNAILALYLNTASYGNLAYGAEAAARLYFGRPVADLDLAQAALLAGLPRAPSLNDPLRHLDAAHRRQRVVLRLMRAHGLITAAQEHLAAAEPLRIGSAANAGAGDMPGALAPHWVTDVLALVAAKLGPDVVARGGLTIRTTLDLAIQQAAVDAVRRRIPAVAATNSAHDAAVVAIAPDSGEILAMVGSADPADRSIDGAYNVALAPRQPGSAIKPFTYIAALDRWSPGAKNLGLTTATLLDDVPSTFRAPDGSLYQPQDYDARFLGRVPLRVALGSSLNVPAVETLQRVGIRRMLDVAHAAGITTMYRADRYGPALTLGGGEVTLLDLTSAYGTIAAGGWRHAPRAILDVTGAHGRALGDWSAPPAVQAFGPRGPRLAALVTDILADDGARLPGFGADGPLVLPDRPAAAKTGTTTDWHDNWTVGYTPDLVAGVWVGNADNSPMQHISGITGAAPIWHDLMEEALRPVAPRPFILPPGMVRAPVCASAGLPPVSTSPPCPDLTDELFIEGTEPAKPSAVSRQPSAFAAITDPPDGSRYLYALSLPASAQQISVQLSAVSRQLLVDGRPAGRCGGTPCAILWPLRPGRHYLQAETADAHGRIVRGHGVTITVATGS